MLHKLSVLFTSLPSRSNSDGIPIYCRVTLNGERKDFSTGIRVKASSWDQEKQRVRTKDQSSIDTNQKLTDIRLRIQNALQTLESESNSISVIDIVERYLNPDGIKMKTLGECFVAKLEALQKLIGKGIVKATHRHYASCFRITQEFLFHAYGRKDLPLSRIDANTLHRLEEYLKTERNATQVHANKVLQRFKTVVCYGVILGWLKSEPFTGFRYKRTKTTVVYLTENELSLLANHSIAQSRLSKVRDMFLFSVYTGLHYIDASLLTRKHIVEMNGEPWIVFTRQKTGVEICIPYLPQAREIQQRLETFAVGEHLLPGISNEKINSYLKEIADIVGIEKRLTHKVARKTFASTILLGNNVPMAVVSNLLGHSSVKITQQHYAQVDKGILSKEMKRVADSGKD